jgi:hypothetical protein
MIKTWHRSGRAVTGQFSPACAKQGEALRKACPTEPRSRPFAGRELSLANIKQVLDTVAKAASAGAAGQPAGRSRRGRLARQAPSPAWTVHWSRRCRPTARRCRQMVDQGANLRETQLKKALADIEKMEDALFDAMRKARRAAGAARARRCKGRGPRCWLEAQGKPTTPAPWPAPPSSSCWTTSSKGCARPGAGPEGVAGHAGRLFDAGQRVLIGMSDALQPEGASPAPSRARKG